MIITALFVNVIPSPDATVAPAVVGTVPWAVGGPWRNMRHSLSSKRQYDVAGH